MPGHRIPYLLILVLLGGLVSPWWSVVGAQEEEEATGHISAHHAEIVFPAVVRFYVSVDVPLSDLETVSLTLNQASGLQVTLAINPEQHLIESRDDGADLVYDWETTSDSGPVPFEPLNYLWEIETDDGTVSSAAHEILFEDTARTPWNSAGEPPLTLYWHNTNLAGGAIRDDVMVAYELISHQIARSPLFRYVIYDPGAALCETEKIPDSEETRQVVFADDGTSFPCAVEMYPQLYANGDMTFLQRPDLGYAVLQDYLIQMMVRDGYNLIWQEASIPDWFTAGLATLYRLRPTYSALQVVQTAARTDSLLQLPEMAVRPGNDEEYQKRVLWDAESYLLVVYLADRYGADAPFDLAHDLREDGFEAAFQALVGDEFWNQWTAWLFTEEVERALGWTPYQPTTPTPTASPTSTPIPPTFTPSPTRTATPTATSTFLGDQLPTLVVQEVTATIAQTPTNTPLPPGSLPTASPEPVVKEVSSDGEDISPVLLGGVIVLAGGVVLLMIIVLVNVIRRR
jgi:hypothetical protein